MKRLLAVALLIAVAAPVSAEKIPIKTRFHNSLDTNVKGTSLTAPPSILVLRSERGVAHMLSKFKKINNRSTQVRVRKLQKRLAGINFSKKMVVAVFSPPMDNYKLKISRIDLENDAIKVTASFTHQLRNYRRPPKKSIHYEMAVVDKSPLPVYLATKQIKVKNRAKEIVKVTVTGRLMPHKKDVYQLIPVKIRRGKKNSYYIRGEKTAELEQYLGRVVTLSGTITHEKDGPYESELTVLKLVKAEK